VTTTVGTPWWSRISISRAGGDPERPLPLGPGTGMAARDARRPASRSAGAADVWWLSRSPRLEPPDCAAPALPRARCGDVAPSPDGRRVAGSRAWTAVALVLARTRRTRVVLLETGGSIADLCGAPAGSSGRRRPDGVPQVYPGATRGRAVRSRSRASRSAPAHPRRSLTAPAYARQGARLGAAPGAGAEGGGPHVPKRCRSTLRRLRVPNGYTMCPSLRPISDPGVRERRANRKVRRRSDGDRRRGRFAYRGPRSFPLTVPRRGGLRPVSLVGQPDARTFRGASWSNLGSPPSARISRVSELDHYAALGARSWTRRWRRLASGRAAVIRAHRFATIPDTSLAASARGNTQNLVGRSVTLTLSRLVMGALSISRRTGHVVPTTGGGTAKAPLAGRTSTLPLARTWRVRVSAASRIMCGAALAGSPPVARPLFRVGGGAAGVTVFFAPSLSATRAFPHRGMRTGELRASVRRGQRRVPDAAASWARAWPPPPRVARCGSTCSPTRVTLGRPTLTAPHPTRSAGLRARGRMTVSYDFPVGRLGVAHRSPTTSGAPRRPSGTRHSLPTSEHAGHCRECVPTDVLILVESGVRRGLLADLFRTKS